MAAVSRDRPTANGRTRVISRFTKETLVSGKPTQIKCLEIGGQTYSISRGFATIVRLEDEWFDDVQDPKAVVAALKDAHVRADLFTFWQRLPDTEPRFDFHTEWESLAALPVKSFDYWWEKQLKPATRNLIRKSEKKGVEIRDAHYDDDFVRGMTAVFNETPIRQGRRFWHYGKDADTVKQQFSRNLSREDLIGAYCGGEMIGFAMVGNAGRYAVLGQIISKLEHRDKSPNNALIAKAVAVCEKRGLPYLVYSLWGEGSLAGFKSRSGFEETRLPRYYVPLTEKGRIALRLGLHRGWKQLVPVPLKTRLKTIRSMWLERSRGSRTE
jgi:hypothetical protein